MTSIASLYRFLLEMEMEMETCRFKRVGSDHQGHALFLITPSCCPAGAGPLLASHRGGVTLGGDAGLRAGCLTALVFPFFPGPRVGLAVGTGPAPWVWEVRSVGGSF